MLKIIPGKIIRQIDILMWSSGGWTVYALPSARLAHSNKWRKNYSTYKSTSFRASPSEEFFGDSLVSFSAKSCSRQSLLFSETWLYSSSSAILLCLCSYVGLPIRTCTKWRGSVRERAACATKAVVVRMRRRIPGILGAVLIMKSFANNQFTDREAYISNPSWEAVNRELSQRS